MSGDNVIQKLLQVVNISPLDKDAGYLIEKLIAGSNISLDVIDSLGDGNLNITINLNISGDGTNSIEIGNGANAKETADISIGNGAISGQVEKGTTNINAISIGNGSKAYELESIAIGDFAIAGKPATTTDDNSISIGASALSDKEKAIAIGYLSNSNGIASVGLGRSCESLEAHCVAIGTSAVAGNNGGDFVEYGAIAIGWDALADKIGAISIGQDSDANGDSSIALGDSSQATADNAIAIGNGVINAAINTMEIGPSNTNKIALDANGIFKPPNGGGYNLNLTTDDKPFMDFEATINADAVSAISSLTISGATTHHVQVDINGTKAWIAVSTNNPT